MSDRYRFARRAGVMLTAIALLGSAGCSASNDKPDTAGPKESSVPSPATTAADIGGTDNGSGGLADYDALRLYTTTMPKPKGAPQDGIWSEATVGEHGREHVNYVDDKGNGYVSVEFLDCRLPAAQALKDKPGEQGVFEVCFQKPTGELKGYPLIVPDDPDNPNRTLTVNHVSILVGPWVNFEDKFNGADVENFITTLDLDSLAKL